MEFKDRVANKPNRVKLTYEDTGVSTFANVELADEPIEEGTPLNAQNMNKLLNKEDNDYIVEQGTTAVDDIVWTYEKWNGGKAVCWATVTTTYYSEKLLEKAVFLPMNLVADPVVIVSLQAIDNQVPEYDRTVKYKINLSGSIGVFVYDVSGDFNSGSTEKVSVYVIGRWK